MRRGLISNVNDFSYQDFFMKQTTFSDVIKAVPQCGSYSLSVLSTPSLFLSWNHAWVQSRVQKFVKRNVIKWSYLN